MVIQYMAFTRGEQKKAGVRVKQAPALLRSHLTDIIAPFKGAPPGHGKYGGKADPRTKHCFVLGSIQYNEARGRTHAHPHPGHS